MNWTTFFVRQDGSTVQLHSTSRWNLWKKRSDLMHKYKNEKMLYISPIKPEGFDIQFPARLVIKPKKVRS